MNHATCILSQEDVQCLKPILSAVLEDGHTQLPYLSHLATVLQQNEPLRAAGVPTDVVALNSVVEIRNLKLDDRDTVQVVLPEQADMAQRRISVLAPVGAAMLGRREGQRFTVFLPSGRTQRYAIEKVLQPHANADRERAHVEHAIP